MNITAQEFKVTYYVGALLAQGGALRIMVDHLLFVPRNIEKAMGASDVEIPFDDIKLVDVTGVITVSLMVRTAGKAHRFVGSDLQNVCDLINQALDRHHGQNPRSSAAHFEPSHPKEDAARHVATSEKAGSSAQCPACFKMMKHDYKFCPACGTGIKKLCSACRDSVDVHWKFCAHCGASI